MLRLNEIVGHISDTVIANKLHDLDHKGLVERISLSEKDTHRKRLRVNTDKGTDCAIALQRGADLKNGSVLLLSDKSGIVIQLDEISWLALEPVSLDAAIELGFLAGHHHWRVRLDGPRLLVAVEQAEEEYKERLARQLDAGTVRIVENN